MNRTALPSNPEHSQTCHPDPPRRAIRMPKDLCAKFTLELPKFADLICNEI